MKTSTPIFGLLGLTTFAIAAPVDDVRRALRDHHVRDAPPYPIPYSYTYTTTSTTTTATGSSPSSVVVGPIGGSGTAPIIIPLPLPTGTGFPTHSSGALPIPTGTAPPSTIIPIPTLPGTVIIPTGTLPTPTGTGIVGPIGTGTGVSSSAPTPTGTSPPIVISPPPCANQTTTCATDGALVCSCDETQYALCNFGHLQFQPVAAGTICVAGQGIIGAGDGACPAGTADGAVVCNGTGEYALCNFGRVQFQPVAPGTECVNGEIVNA